MKRQQHKKTTGPQATTSPMYAITANGELIAVRSSVDGVKKVARTHFSQLDDAAQPECRLRLYRGPVADEDKLLEVSNNNQSWRLRWRKPRTADLGLNAAMASIFGSTSTTNNARPAP